MARKTEALTEEKTKLMATAKLLEEAAKEKLELNKKHYEEAQQAKLVLNKLQTTYQHQVIEYEGHAQVVVVVILRLKSVTVRDVRRVKYDERGWNVIMLLMCISKCVSVIVSVSNYVCVHVDRYEV
mgnify:CR=1 FL=1